MTRTHDLLITNQLLYRLSYSSIFNFLRPGLVVTNQLLYRLSYTSKYFDSGGFPWKQQKKMTHS